MAETFLQPFEDNACLGGFAAVKFKTGKALANGGIIRPATGQPVGLEVRPRIAANHGDCFDEPLAVGAGALAANGTAKHKADEVTHAAAQILLTQLVAVVAVQQVEE